MVNGKSFFDERNSVSIKAKKLGYISIVIMLFIAFGAMKPHPYHVSYTEISYQKEKKEITFAVEVFTDDLENAIKLTYKPEKIYLGSDSTSAESQKYIQAYFQENIIVIIDGIVLKEMQFVGMESNPDRTLIYFTYNNLPPFNSLAIYNTTLISLFPDQQNIMELTESGNKHKALLSKDKNNVTWVLKK